ncbi:transcription termination/antitermination protein NusG [Jiulongibacter sediminis]|jgi:transcriptional antiterminator NusG|uniref:Transcription termination/antitermination protein NusG n=1 Tax=Jiulongibacter sediminis TaxID=1605367 RepID=A0A0P7BR16_9BACT|nr:transcription termination/antitermination protein NusG [Jiulongibacter sediminis]KPM46618.1 antitermination protein NusG [Jiulongibacter sediminis]TBX21476.1 antitermination protein NusG [Jiulongibacter sediminis]
MSELNWYVIRAVSGQEKKIKNYIENEAARENLTDFIPQVLIPSEKIVEIRNGKKRVREKNYLPGYMLIQADLNNGEVMHMVKSLPGVIGFLRKDGNSSIEPEPLRQSEINRFLGVQNEEEEETIDSNISFAVGESVKVIDGPFSTFEGSVEEVFEDKKKLNVSVKIFGRSTPVELSYLQVEKLS